MRAVVDNATLAVPQRRQPDRHRPHLVDPRHRARRRRRHPLRRRARTSRRSRSRSSSSTRTAPRCSASCAASRSPSPAASCSASSRTGGRSCSRTSPRLAFDYLDVDFWRRVNVAPARHLPVLRPARPPPGQAHRRAHRRPQGACGADAAVERSSAPALFVAAMAVLVQFVPVAEPHRRDPGADLRRHAAVARAAHRLLGPGVARAVRVRRPRRVGHGQLPRRRLDPRHRRRRAHRRPDRRRSSPCRRCASRASTSRSSRSASPHVAAARHPGPQPLRRGQRRRRAPRGARHLLHRRQGLLRAVRRGVRARRHRRARPEAGRVRSAARRRCATARRRAPPSGSTSARTKLAVFCLSAFIAGIAGALFGGLQSSVSDITIEPINNIVLFLFAVVGGITTVSGAFLGGALFALLPYVQSEAPGAGRARVRRRRRGGHRPRPPAQRPRRHRRRAGRPRSSAAAGPAAPRPTPTRRRRRRAAPVAADARRSSVRPSSARRRWVAVAGLGLVAAAVRPRRIADRRRPRRPTTRRRPFGGFASSGRANGLQLTYNVENVFPIPAPIFQASVPEASATMESGPTATALGSVAYPGSLLANLPAVVAQSDAECGRVRARRTRCGPRPPIPPGPRRPPRTSAPPPRTVRANEPFADAITTMGGADLPPFVRIGAITTSAAPASSRAPREPVAGRGDRHRPVLRAHPHRLDRHRPRRHAPTARRRRATAARRSPASRSSACRRRSAPTGSPCAAAARAGRPSDTRRRPAPIVDGVGDLTPVGRRPSQRAAAPFNEALTDRARHDERLRQRAARRVGHHHPHARAVRVGRRARRPSAPPTASSSTSTTTARATTRSPSCSAPSRPRTCPARASPASR